MFEPIEISINWGLLIGLISLIITIIGLIVKLFKKSGKGIDVRDILVQSYVNKPTIHNDKIKILYNNIEIESLQSIIIYIKNIGTEVLNEDDFNLLPTIELSGFNKILNYNVFSSSEFTSATSKIIEENKLQIKLNNFESGKYIKVEIAFESIEDEHVQYFSTCLKNNNKIGLEYKNHDAEKSLGMSKDYNALMPIMCIVFGIVYGLTYLVVKYGLGVDLSETDNISIGWKILYFLPPSLTTLFFIWKYLQSLNNWYGEWDKIKKWNEISS